MSIPLASVAVLSRLPNDAAAAAAALPQLRD